MTRHEFSASRVAFTFALRWHLAGRRVAIGRDPGKPWHVDIAPAT